MPSHHRSPPIAGAIIAMLAACGTTRPFVWADQLPDPPPAASGEYRIAARDVLAVRVWNQDTMSTPRSRVRDDGKISLPFLQDVQAAGLTPKELSSRLQVELEKFVLNPVVTITLEERASVGVSVLGEVANPGAYELQSGALILHAIAAAGGLTEYAEDDGIYVLRMPDDGGSEPQRIRFRYEALTGGSHRFADFTLRRGDVVVVE